MMRLSVVISTLNDGPELSATLKSIRDTAGDQVEIICIDDASGCPVTAACANIHLASKVIQNQHRCGVGPSRTIGVSHATGTHVMLCDSHMRFKPGWYEEVMKRVEGRLKTIHCTTCAGLDRDHLDINAPVSLYHGATLNVCGPDKNDPTKTQVMEAVWNNPAPDDDAEICCPMGASYCLSKEWFQKLDPLRLLRSWGGDEVQLALKSWLSGGDVRLIKSVQIGHRFLISDENRGGFIVKGERQQWTCPIGHPTYNKLLAIHTLLPAAVHPHLLNKLQETTNTREWMVAKDMMRADWHLFETERLRNEAMFVRSWAWLVERFGLKVV